jgi:hypothetical protein
MKKQKITYEIEFSGMIIEIPVSIEAKTYDEAVKIAEKSPNVYLTRAFKEFFDANEAKKAKKAKRKKTTKSRIKMVKKAS